MKALFYTRNKQLMGSHFTRSSKRNNAHKPHSLDEVAGSFVREALFPSSRQIYKTGTTTKKKRKPHLLSERRQKTQCTKKKKKKKKKCPLGYPTNLIVCRVPDRIMCPELTGSPVRGCSQVVLWVLSLQERHLLLNGNKTIKQIKENLRLKPRQRTKRW